MRRALDPLLLEALGPVFYVTTSRQPDKRILRIRTVWNPIIADARHIPLLLFVGGAYERE